MATDAETMPKTSGQPKRLLRNFLLDTRFQLKYTGMVVLVTVIVTGAVGAWLGSEAYRYSQESTQVLTAQAAGVSPELFAYLQEQSSEKDATVLRNIVIGISVLVVVLALALGFTGIIVTHRVVGPAYKLKLMLGDIERGSLKMRGGFRKGDELQDVGDAFKRMVSSLRERRTEELAQLESAIERAEKASLDTEVLDDLRKLRDRLKRTLDT